jgi:hypothetical protein
MDASPAPEGQGADTSDPAPDDLLGGSRRTVAFNRRELFRVPVVLPVDVSMSRSGADAVNAITLDISHGGARVFFPTRLDQDQTVWLSLRLDGDAVMTASATVRHCVKKTNGYVTGMAFGVLTAGDGRALALAIARHQRRMGPQVQSSQLVHWTPQSATRSRPATTVALSPGAVALHTQDQMDIGDHLSLSLRAAADQFVLGATVVDQHFEEERHRSLLALDVLDRAEENKLRSALLQLADEEYWSERPA